mmetsp:Transcript_24112/g.26771  ORF Transcript_24112/g.26771 Transcript_24112/m.26771 type:complete len:203 (+) Transcript_24112:134-742(+)
MTAMCDCILCSFCFIITLHISQFTPVFSYKQRYKHIKSNTRMAQLCLLRHMNVVYATQELTPEGLAKAKNDIPGHFNNYAVITDNVKRCEDTVQFIKGSSKTSLPLADLLPRVNSAADAVKAGTLSSNTVFCGVMMKFIWKALLYANIKKVVNPMTNKQISVPENLPGETDPTRVAWSALLYKYYIVLSWNKTKFKCTFKPI